MSKHVLYNACFCSQDGNGIVIYIWLQKAGIQKEARESQNIASGDEFYWIFLGIRDSMYNTVKRDNTKTQINSAQIRN